MGARVGANGFASWILGPAVARNFDHGNSSAQCAGCRAIAPSRVLDTSSGNVRVFSNPERGQRPLCACHNKASHGHPTTDESGDDVVWLVDHPQRYGINGPKVKAGRRDRTSFGGRAKVGPPGDKIGDTLIQHVLCKQESGLTEILSRPPQHIFCRFENQRMRENMFPFNPQVLYFKKM